MKAQVHVGEAITRERERQDMPRNALAVRAGVDPSYLMRIERGTVAHPSVYTVQAIAVALGVTVEDLMTQVQAR